MLKKGGTFTAVDYRLTPHQKARSLMRLDEMYEVDRMYLVSAEDFKVRENYEVVPVYAAFCL